MSASQRQVSSQPPLSHPRHNPDSLTLTVLIFFEHLITTDSEIDLFWKHKFSVPAAVFLTNRYIILVFSALNLEAAFDIFMSAEVSQTPMPAIPSALTSSSLLRRELCFSQPLADPGDDNRCSRCNGIAWANEVANLTTFIPPAGRRRLNSRSERHSTENQLSSVLCDASNRSHQI